MNTRRATVTIEPRGPKTTAQRQYQVRFTLDVDTAAEKPLVLEIAKAALAPLAATEGSESHFGELAIKTKATAIEARVAIAGPPAESAMQHLRTALGTAGFNVTITEQRECDECMASVMVPWNQASPPPGWHTLSICGKHQYKSCVACNSVYLMSSTNAGGPAPSLKCTVCDAVMIEWGGTKLWFAELVSRAADRR
ncbi:MAG: hypothetical protein JWM53_4991 [bacterium]|nr:hypothetical protein [bacterium]